MLISGYAESSKIGLPLEAGRIFGEIALCSPAQTRAQNVRALSDCTLLQMSGATVRTLSYQTPAFSLHLMELLTMRLGASGQHAERRSTPGEATAAG